MSPLKTILGEVFIISYTAWKILKRGKIPILALRIKLLEYFTAMFSILNYIMIRKLDNSRKV